MFQTPAIVVAITLGLCGGGAAFQAFTVPSRSMEPTVLKGDYLMVRRLDGDLPKRGDVIVYRQPLNGYNYVKRVIGLPGERVQIIQGQVYVNDKAWALEKLPGAIEAGPGGGSRPVLRWRETNADGRKYRINDYGPDGDLDNTEVYEVPPGQYFVMGDNRDNSLDSRVPADQGGGFVPASNVIGAVYFRLGFGALGSGGAGH